MNEAILDKVRKAFNKDINVNIGQPTIKDKTIFGTEEVLNYPSKTKISRILIDTGLAAGHSQLNGTSWKNYQIPKGFNDFYLNGLQIWKGTGYGRHPHRLTIMNYD